MAKLDPVSVVSSVPERRRVAVSFAGKVSRTKKGFKDEVDINKIIERMQSSGVVSHLNSRPPFYGDVSEMGDYRQCIERVQKAEALFMGFPARVREKFQNDPAQFLAFVADPLNREKAVELGIIDRPPRKAVEEPKAPSEGSAPIVPK